MEAVIKLVRIGLTVITERLILIMCLMMSFGLACWAMYDPETNRLITLGLFAILVYLPLMLRERKENDVNKEGN